jgi:hypothetical protein
MCAGCRTVCSKVVSKNGLVGLKEALKECTFGPAPLMNVVKNSLSRKNLGQTQRRRDCWHIRLVRLWKAWQATVGAL